MITAYFFNKGWVYAATMFDTLIFKINILSTTLYLNTVPASNGC